MNHFFIQKLLAYAQAMKHNHKQILSMASASQVAIQKQNLKTPNQTKTKTYYLKAGYLAVPAFLIGCYSDFPWRPSGYMYVGPVNTRLSKMH
jgi:hypothetical protein